MIVGLGSYGGTGRATRVPLTAPFAHVWRMREGMVTGWRGYTDTKLTDLLPAAAGETWSTTLAGIGLPGISITLA